LILNEGAMEFKLLKTKIEYGLTDVAFNAILSDIGSSFTLYKLQKRLQKLININPIKIDMCKNSCIAFTGDYETHKCCPLCLQPRNNNNNQSISHAFFFSLIDRLKIQYADSKRAQEFLYRHEYIQSKIENDEQDNYGDIFDGK
jgi:hypothetical protein